MYFRCFAHFAPLAIVLAAPLAAVADDPGRIAIIDASLRTDKHLDDLKKAGVLVIGRYMGRCLQWKGKRMIDNKDEVKAILGADFAVLSIYQYKNDNALKFAGKEPRVYHREYAKKDDPDGSKAKARDEQCPLSAWPAGWNKHEIAISLPDQSCTARVVKACRDKGAFHTVTNEAQWDAQAALEQAHELDQPAGSAIYFGVDFDAELKKDPELRQGLIEYFTIVSNALRGDARQYLVGAYGNGAALELLVQTKVMEGAFKDRSLVDLTWFNASPGHDRTGIVYNGGDGVEKDAKFDWDLFQSRVAVDYPSSAKGISVDFDIQNKRNADKYVGFWKRAELYKVPAAQTAAIFDQRRFVCSGKAIIRSGPEGDAVQGLYCGRKSDDRARAPIYHCNNDGFYPADKRSRICFGALTRVQENPGNYVRIDCDEDGTFEGWTAASNLGRTMAKRPIWTDNKDERREMTLDRTACDK